MKIVRNFGDKIFDIFAIDRILWDEWFDDLKDFLIVFELIFDSKNEGNDFIENGMIEFNDLTISFIENAMI